MKWAILIFLSVLLFAGLVYGAWFDTSTYDEPANMAAAFDYVYRKDYRIYPDNPPLVKILAGLALLPISQKINFPSALETYADPTRFDLYAFGRDFLYNSGNNARLIIFLTRLPNILFTLALGILLYFFAKDLYGEKSGILALFLYTLDPNIRGHGHILAFDIPLAAFIMLILYLTYKMFSHSGKRGTSASRIRGGSWTSQDDGFETSSHLSSNIYYLIIPLIFALGFLTKFTFIFFAVIYFGGMIINSTMKQFNNVTMKEKIGKLEHWNIGTFSIILILTTSFLSLWFFGIFTNYNKKTLDYDLVPIISIANKSLSHDLKWNLFKVIPVPYYYKIGMMTMYTHDIISQPAFLLGQVHAKNDWFFYFPVSFLLKTPIPTLILIISTFFLLVKRNFILLYLKTGDATGGPQSAPQRKLGASTEWGRGAAGPVNYDKKQDPRRYLSGYLISYFPFLLGFTFMLFMMLFSHINNVYRYLFPSLVLFILGASQIVNLLDFRKRSFKLFLLICLFAYLLIISFLSFPFDLSYTNEFTGIPPQGFKYLSDSEVDWGQDLERLGKWLKTYHTDKKAITLSYLGTADPSYYGINYKPLRFDELNHLSGIVAVSVGNLTLGDWQWRSLPEYKLGMLKAPLDFLRAKKPEAVIGKSIFIYRFL